MAKVNNGSQYVEWLGNDATYYGGNGEDTLIAWGNENTLFGENGIDLLAAIGRGNALDGGRGDDILISQSSGDFYEIGLGNVMTGGQGEDTFSLSNTSDMIAINDTNSVVDNGDRIVGVFDVITDYAAGEMLYLPVSSMATSPVQLDSFSPGHKHLILADGEYALIRGTAGTAGRFTASDEGPDTLVVYDAADGVDEDYLQGAVVLIGVTDPAEVAIPLPV